MLTYLEDSYAAAHISAITIECTIFLPLMKGVLLRIWVDNQLAMTSIVILVCKSVNDITRFYTIVIIFNLQCYWWHTRIYGMEREMK